MTGGASVPIPRGSAAVVDRRRQKRDFTLSPEALALLERVGNASGYVDALVRQRHEEWSQALVHLLERGWTKPELRRVLDQIATPPAFPQRPSLSAGPAVEGTIGEVEARAILVLARERAAGNEDVAARLGY